MTIPPVASSRRLRVRRPRSAGKHVSRSVERLPWRPSTLGDRVAAAVALGAIVLVAVTGSLVALRATLWAPIDEGAHFNYVQNIATTRRLPILDQTRTSEQVAAIGQHVYPKIVQVTTKTTALNSYSYEAFQPPLAYALDVPVYELSSNFVTKVKLLRFFGLFLLLATLVIGASLSRLVLRTRWWFGLAAMGLVASFPGLVVRVTTVSNLPLEMVMVMAVLATTMSSIVRDRPSRLVFAGILLGLSILTDLFCVELVPIVAFAMLHSIWRKRGSPREAKRRSIVAVTGGVLAAGIVAPWLVFNERHYHSLTASALAKSMQISLVNPTHAFISVRQLFGLLYHQTFQPLFPEELGVSGHVLASDASIVVTVVMVPLALLFAIAARRSWYRLVLAAAWISNVALAFAISYFGQWLSILGRYTFPTLILLALAGVVGAVEWVRSQLLLAVSLVLVLGALVVVWVPMIPNVKVI